MKIAYIGNFEPAFSTENDRAWSFNKLGHKVFAFQENRCTTDLLKEHFKKIKPDVVFYSHTHGWEIPGLKGFFKQLDIPSVSVHLDRWAWLEREKEVGKEATWFTDFQFMADGSPEARQLYDDLDLNWHYLKPGVVERDCYMAEPDHKRFPHDVVFVGSQGYHKEYPFRQKMVQRLKAEFGNQFGHYGGDGSRVVRGEDLNILYASSLVVVGDSCFGGRPYYVSDRYYETRGRGGFLLHPHVEGVDRVGVAHYQPLQIPDLMREIYFYLDYSRDRERMRKEGHTHVKNHETYTHRSQEMLEVIFPDLEKNKYSPTHETSKDKQ